MAAARDSRPPARPPPFLLVAPSGRRRTSCKCAAEEPICCFIGLPLILHRVGYAARVQICLFVCPHRQSSFSSLARPAPGARNERRRVVGKQLRPSFKRRKGRSVVVWWRVCQLGHAIDDDDDNDGEAPRARAASRQFRPDMSVADGGKVTCEAIPKRHACFSGGLAEIGAHARASVMLVVCLVEEGGGLGVSHTPQRKRWMLLNHALLLLSGRLVGRGCGCHPHSESISTHVHTCQY